MRPRRARGRGCCRGGCDGRRGRGPWASPGCSGGGIFGAADILTVMTNARDIRVIVSDVDGVWTDGKIIYAGDRSEVKEFNVRDGLGPKPAQPAGFTIVLLTSRSSPALMRRAKELGIAELHQGAANKLTVCQSILA